MPANLLDSYKIAYFGLPKAASTSVKLVLYELVHGEPFQGFYDDVHPKFPIFPIKDEDFASAEGYWRFTVVRDPVKRILSAYGNRVIEHQDIRRNAALGKRKRVLFHLRHPTLRVFPSPNGFYEKLEQYQAVSYSIWHHTTAIST